ncbi:RNA ligase family protein [Comamonas sp. JNW]|uniref:RNA ligase family protein n=1 Tax=Comamonas sp. JNW TaxID=2170731 RepID=UPI000DE6AECB|nr:RNA ligase family protein [Comamonas sp. JNW]PWB15877.1 DNA ligase [Comamonas sp. JNW]
MNPHTLSIFKYPRTPHLEGSRLQAGDDASDQVPLKALAGQHVVIEEKLDGANAGISFSGAGDQLLQSRGHYLVGGGSERQFNLFKVWAAAHEAALLERLEDRFVVYGEWTYAKHSVFYDQLPHHFHEFDMLDRETGQFLSTPRRHALLQGSPVLSVPVLYEGLMPTDPALLWALVQPSLAKSRAWRQSFDLTVQREGLPPQLCWQQTNNSDLAEGLYLKVEADGQVVARYKLVRQDFLQTILDSGSHHSQRPMIANSLAPGVDLYAPQPSVSWEDLSLHTIRSLDALKALARSNRAAGPDGARRVLGRSSPGKDCV